MFCELRKTNSNTNWRRLAFFTLPAPENSENEGGMAHVNRSKLRLIDCIVELDNSEKEKLREALYCYTTFIDVIESTNVIEVIGDKVHFEFYDETFYPPVKNISDNLL